MASLPLIVDYPEAQQDQMNVLESIYGENFRRVQGKKTAWQVNTQKHRAIRLIALKFTDTGV